jgi:hypothetical protein
MSPPILICKQELLLANAGFEETTLALESLEHKASEKKNI